MTEVVGYTRSERDFDGRRYPIYRRGEGPGVVVIHEVPGITPEVRAFGDRVAEAGYTVVMPHLFGTPNKPMTAPYALGQIARACVSREFTVLASRASSPVTLWLRALCRELHAELGGPGVGVVGMCLTGNFALAMMVEPAVMAPVLSQPSLPFAFGSLGAGLHLSDDDLAVVRRRACDEGAGVLGLRFTHDWMCPGRRFRAMKEALGDGFEGIEIDSGPGNPHGIKRVAHSVLTNDLVDEEGHPTRAALDRVLALFDERLRRS